jgi:hypothetical protein
LKPVMIEPRGSYTARELAKELIPGLEALANICYLMERNPEPVRMRELLRAKSRVIAALTQTVEKEL